MQYKFGKTLLVCVLSMYLMSCEMLPKKEIIVDTACTDFRLIELSSKTLKFFEANIFDGDVLGDAREIAANNKIWKDKGCERKPEER